MREYLADAIFHDAHLLGVSIEGGILRLLFDGCAGRTQLCIADVYSFAVSGLQASNTVEGVYFEPITDDNCDAFITEIQTASGGVALLGDPVLIKASILRSGFSLLVVEPSEGASVLAMCRRDAVRFEQVENAVEGRA